MKRICYVYPMLALIGTLLLCAVRPALAITDAELNSASLREADAYIRRYGLSRDPAINARFQRIFDRVAANAGSTRWPLRLFTLNSPSPNAFALPNGMLFVNVGLLRLDTSDDELAFVMAHEISHVTHEHAKKDINNRQVQGAILSVLTRRSDALVQLAAQAIQATIEGGYSRGQETQADINALGIMARADYNPAAALTFFQKLAQVEGRSRGIRAFSNHPLTSDRIRNVQKWIAEHPDVMARFQHAIPAQPLGVP